MAKIPESEIYRYLTEEKGLSHNHAMGMLTNIIAESGLNPSIYEEGADLDTAGLGLFQYTFPKRREEFIKKVPDWQNNWKAQIDFALSEPETKAYLNKEFETEADAVKDFTINWERPKDAKKRAEERVETYLPQVQENLSTGYSPVSGVLDETARALGIDTSDDIMTKAQNYLSLKEYDKAVAAGESEPSIVHQDYTLDRPQAEQYLEKNQELNDFLKEFDKQYEYTKNKTNPLNPEFTGPLPDKNNLSPSQIDQLKSMMQGERTPTSSSEIDYKEKFKNNTPDSVDRNLLAKLKGQDYMGLLTDIGAYAARMAPLNRAMREASSYDEERYPRFAPIVPTATLPKRDVRDAFATAQQAALQQGKLDLGALSALATQQAKETARVEESVANERGALLNQVQQLNNQITMQEMADTAANKGAAQTMQYQALAAMSEMGQGSLREANMRRNDAIVKEMFESVFDELKDIKSNRA